MLGLDTISSKLKTLIALAAFLAFSAGLVYAGYWLSKPTIEDLSKRNLALAAQDSTRLIELGDMRSSYERAVFDFVNEKELREFVEDSLGKIANALKDQADKDARTIESLVAANATLRDRLSGPVEVVRDGSNIVVGIDTEKRYQDGSIAVEGQVNISTDSDPPTGTSELDVSVIMSPTVAISRDESGLAQCDLSFGDMPMTVSDLKCVNDLDPDLGTRRSLWCLFGTMGLTGGIAAGLAVLVALVAF